MCPFHFHPSVKLDFQEVSNFLSQWGNLSASGLRYFSSRVYLHISETLRCHLRLRDYTGYEERSGVGNKKVFDGRFSVGQQFPLSKPKGKLQTDIKELKPKTVNCWTCRFLLGANDKSIIQINICRHGTSLAHVTQERKEQYILGRVGTLPNPWNHKALPPVCHQLPSPYSLAPYKCFWQFLSLSLAHSPPNERTDQASLNYPLTIDGSQRWLPELAVSWVCQIGLGRRARKATKPHFSVHYEQRTWEN